METLLSQQSNHIKDSQDITSHLIDENVTYDEEVLELWKTNKIDFNKMFWNHLHSGAVSKQVNNVYYADDFTYESFSKSVSMKVLFDSLSGKISS